MYVYYVSLKAQNSARVTTTAKSVVVVVLERKPTAKTVKNLLKTCLSVVASLTSWHMHLILERSKARLASAPRTSKWYLRGVSSSAAGA